MLEQISNEIDTFVNQSREHIGFWLTCIACLWGLNIVNWMLKSPLHRFGIFPRHVYGLPGIFIAPFLHGNVNHLFFNTIPLFMLGLFLLADGVLVFTLTTIIIMVLTGAATWLIGRPGNHIGASSVIAGYFGYVLAQAYESPTFTTILLALVALYYFGGILLSILPSDERTSWEGHLTGLVAGIATPFLLPIIFA